MCATIIWVDLFTPFCTGIWPMRFTRERDALAPYLTPNQKPWKQQIWLAGGCSYQIFLEKLVLS